MRYIAKEVFARRVPLGDAHPVICQEILCRAVRNVISTELALFTFAQIIDGLPTVEVCVGPPVLVSVETIS